MFATQSRRGRPGRHGHAAHVAGRGRLQLHHGRFPARRCDAPLSEHQLPRRALRAQRAGPETGARVRGPGSNGAPSCSPRHGCSHDVARAILPAAPAIVPATGAMRPAMPIDLKTLHPRPAWPSQVRSQLVPLPSSLRFQLDHALARDAVHQALESGRTSWSAHLRSIRPPPIVTPTCAAPISAAACPTNPAPFSHLAPTTPPS